MTDGMVAKRLTLALVGLLQDRPSRVSVNALLVAAVALARADGIDRAGVHAVLDGAIDLVEHAGTDARDDCLTVLANCPGGKA